MAFENRTYQIWTKRKIPICCDIQCHVLYHPNSDHCTLPFLISDQFNYKNVDPHYRSTSRPQQTYSVPMNSTGVWFVQKKSPIQWLMLLRKPSISTEHNENWRRQIPFCNRWPLQTSTEIVTGFHIICIRWLNNKWTMIPNNRHGQNEQLENTILILSKPQMTKITERNTSSIKE